MKKGLVGAAISAVIGVSALALSAGGASAYVVCNNVGDCWHTDHRYRYGSDIGVQYHPDDWYFHRDWNADRDHHWREYHDGRGYWRNGVWVTF